MADYYINVSRSLVYQGTMQPGDRLATEAEVSQFQRGTLGITVKDYENRVQKYLDDTANEKGYDDIYTCIGYKGDPDPVFNAEATTAQAWRSTVWRKAQEILNKAVSDEIPPPTYDELIAELPVIEWPVVATE